MRALRPGTCVSQINRCKKRKMLNKDNIRINTPQENAEKFKQVLLYVLAKTGVRPNMSSTVLYKTLYFIDFDYYEKYEEQLVGAKYIKSERGPIPVMFAKIIDELEKEDRIKTLESMFYGNDQVKYLVNPSKKLDVSALSSRELDHVNWEIDRLGNMSAVQISELSLIDTPCVMAENREQLEYEGVFYRPQLTSVREYEKL